MPLAPIDAAINVGNSLQQALDAFLGFLPNLLGFLVILIVGYFVAKLVKAVVRKVLDKVGVDRALHRSEAGQYVERVSPGASPAALIGAVVFWLIFIFVLSAAIGALKIPAVTAAWPTGCWWCAKAGWCAPRCPPWSWRSPCS